MKVDDIRTLTGEQKRRVLEEVERKHFTCENCGSRDFQVGDALYLGFLFRSEQNDDYMVGLTCENPDCAAPRTGIRLSESEFLSET
jgi:hypothetical protein